MKKLFSILFSLIFVFIGIFSFSFNSSAKELAGTTFVYTLGDLDFNKGVFFQAESSIPSSHSSVGSFAKKWSPPTYAGNYTNYSGTFNFSAYGTNPLNKINYFIVRYPGTQYEYNLYFISTSPFKCSFNIKRYVTNTDSFTNRTGSVTARYADSSGNFYACWFPFATSILRDSILLDSSYIFSSSDVYYGVSDSLISALMTGVITDPNEPGGKPDNALFDGNLGNFSNIQKHTVTKTEDYRNTGLGATIPTNYYWQFGWDKKTNLDYLLSDYYVGIKFVCDVGVPNGNGGFTYTTNYSNGWNYFEKHATYSQAISQKYIISNYCSSHNINYDPDTVMSYSIKNIRFYLKPVIKHDNKYYYGGSTLVQFSSAGDGYNNVKTENVINPDDTDNPNKPSADQSGTGSDTHKHGYTDDSFSSGVEDFNSNLKTDLSGIRQATDEILESIKGIPQIFNSIFGWLPSWVISMFAWLIGFIILCIAISLIIKVVT